MLGNEEYTAIIRCLCSLGKRLNFYAFLWRSLHNFVLYVPPFIFCLWATSLWFEFVKDLMRRLPVFFKQLTTSIREFERKVQRLGVDLCSFQFLRHQTLLIENYNFKRSSVNVRFSILSILLLITTLMLRKSDLRIDDESQCTTT